MRQILGLLIGFGLGAVIGFMLISLFAPQSGQQFAANLKRGFAETMDEARKASQQRRLELEAELASMRAKNRLKA